MVSADTVKDRASEEHDEKLARGSERSVITREHVRLINLSSPIWIRKGKVIRCLKHNVPIGYSHRCDEDLANLTIPGSALEALQISEGSAKGTADMAQSRLNTILK